MDKSLEWQFVVVLMMCLTVESFCCCISIEIAAQVISVVTTLMSAVIMVLYGSAALLTRMSQIKMMFYSAMSLAAGLQCLAGTLLCYGAFQRRPRFLWPWLVIAGATGASLLVITLAGCIVLIVEARLTGDAYFIISAYVIYSSFLLYCAFVVNSRRREMLKESKESDSATTLMRYPSPYGYH